MSNASVNKRPTSPNWNGDTRETMGDVTGSVSGPVSGTNNEQFSPSTGIGGASSTDARIATNVGGAGTNGSVLSSTLRNTSRSPHVLLCTSSFAGQQILYTFPPPISSNMSECPLTHFYNFKASSIAPLLMNHTNDSSTFNSHSCNVFSIPPYFFISRSLQFDSSTLQKCSLAIMIPTMYIKQMGEEFVSFESKSSMRTLHSGGATDTIGESTSVLSDITVYQTILHKIMNAYVREQKRNRFLEKTLTALTKAKEAESTWESLHQSVRTWPLIQNLMKLAMAVQHGGRIEFRINGWIEVSCHLPSLSTMRFEESPRVRLFDACIKVREEALPDRLRFPPDGLQDIQNLSQWISPLKSAQTLAQEQNLAPAHGLKILQHLVNLGIIRPIPKLTRNTKLVISEDANFPPSRDDIEKFQNDIQSKHPRIPSLVELLVYFSRQRPYQSVYQDLSNRIQRDYHNRESNHKDEDLDSIDESTYYRSMEGDHNVSREFESRGSRSSRTYSDGQLYTSHRSQNQDRAIIETIVWLLETCYIRSVRQYIQLCIPPDISSYLHQSSPNTSNASLSSTTFIPRTKILNDYEVEYLRGKCNDPKLLSHIKRLCGLFNGEYTFEEILSLDKEITRDELVKLLTEYKDIIITYDV